MTTSPSKRHVSMAKSPVIEWLLDSDPSIRWQVMRDLTDAHEEEITAERAKVATEGWGAQLLSLQGSDGRWGGAAWSRGWNSTLHVLMLLREMGLDPAIDQARRAVSLVRERVMWKGSGPPECEDNHFFEGELEACINGQVGAVGAYFGLDVQGIVYRLLGKSCQTAAGTAKRRTARRGLRSTPRSVFWKPCLNTNGKAEGFRRRLRRVYEGRSTSLSVNSSVNSSVGARPAR